MDATAQLKRDLWVMKEIMDAYPWGITLDTLQSKWKRSYLNEKPERELNERTFLRIRRTLENVFSVNIECDRTDGGRYNLSSEDAVPGESSLLSLINRKNENQKDEKENSDSSLKDILSLLLDRGPIPEKETAILGEIYTNIKKIPLEVQEEFRKLVQDNKIKGADSEEPDRFYKPDYLDVWNAERYQQNGLWLSLGFLENEIHFYIVTYDRDEETIEKISSELDLDEGIQYRGRWWWFEPRDKNLFSLKYEIRPKMTEIVSHTEKLLKIIDKFEK